MKHPHFEISGRQVGYDHKPLIIAEIGINHNGSLAVAIEMAEAAIAAGADVVKHQTHIVEDEMSALAKNTIPGNAKKSIYEIMQACALNEADEFELMKFVQKRGAIFLSTPFSRAAANRLENFDVPAYKIGSGECNNYPLLEHIAAFKKPIILSTGMNSLPSVAKAVEIFRKHKVPFALLHTTNLYPTPDHLVRLGAMVDLQNEFPDAVVGLSDHTVSNYACFGAVALGASVLERHFTDTMSRSGTDISCSMDPAALQDLVKGSLILQKQRGGDKHKDLPEEQVTRDFAYATVVTICPIRAGETFTTANLWVKRPGIGKIKAEHFFSILGKTAKRDIANDEHLDWADFQ